MRPEINGILLEMSADVSSARHEASHFESTGGYDHRPSHPRRCGIADRKKAIRAVRKAPRRRLLQYGLALIAASLCVTPVQAVLVPFENCLQQSYINSVPKKLQFTPTFVDVSFDAATDPHNLRFKVYGNVSGAYTNVNLPTGNDPAWSDPKFTDGKIENLPQPIYKYTTLYNKINVLTYQPWSQFLNFCDQLDNGVCPLGPAFSADIDHPDSFPNFEVWNSMDSSYAFTSLIATFLIINGDLDPATNLGCISTEVTPDLGGSISDMLRLVPFTVLILVGIATAVAGILSPWGTTNLFKWTTNYGRDADLLRLVTPGFGDCLQYIQFAVLTGGLSLSYPGFYQPVVSKFAWSALMFDKSFVTKGDGTKALVDGIYVTHGTHGLDHISQLVGMTDVTDIWAGMAVWLLSIIAIVIAVIQIGFFLQWAFRRFSRIQEEDLRSKNMPFTVGNVIRMVFSYFLLPITTFSMFQLVIAGSSPPAPVALAALLLVTLVIFAGWLLHVVASSKPRSFLFDDLRTVLLYGSLYNTYSDDAATFALVPVLLTFVRGIGIGAVQPSGIAQIVLLAICEVINIVALHAFRPFHSPTSMNAYHTFFAGVRFTSILLMVAFAPSLDVSDGVKAWIGYSILVLHAIVLIFGFLLNAFQTIVEVVARLAGVGVDDDSGFAKVFGLRQLSRRLPRGAYSKQSQGAPLVDRKSPQLSNGGLRTQSASSGHILLDGARAIDRNSSASIQPTNMDGCSSYTPTTAQDGNAFPFLPSAAVLAGQKDRGALTLNTVDTSDPYYRPPRARRPTIDAYSPGARSRGSWASGDWGMRRSSQPGSSTAGDPFEGPSASGRETPVPSFMTAQNQHADRPSQEHRRSKTDYTTREVDFYYGVRGPALNANVPNRRLRTGPVDPTNPVTVASGWFKNLLGGKTKEKGKGFEVVRSSRMPPGMVDPRNGPSPESPPEGIPVAATGAIRRDLDNDEPTNVGEGNETMVGVKSPLLPKHDDDSDDDDLDEGFEMTHISDAPPLLPELDRGKGLEIPSRFPSKASSRMQQPPLVDEDIPIPRKSSKRASQQGLQPPDASGQLSFVSSSPGTSARGQHDDQSGPSHSRNDSVEPPLISLDDSLLGNLNDHTRHDRPTSMGVVRNHSIRVTDQGSDVDEVRSSAAEIVSLSSQRSRETGRSGWEMG
ncbi:hypothetical protein VC83_05111 [Pseudogymnoascus destructans]|uniref:ML-like domain-containing protein n=1 Tax=Pseudogymnoascus destructans TaxID=655981 RepID=A0A177ABF9_9PEZI|nr:uncharacterized protein VC83_05111 [Pseudogymnoascus destructans]OAF58591.1 hypothetical protein VC83_05111 [Pseudogymnoascus destructans]